MEKDLKDAMYGTRLLVFVEESPQSNKYRQVILDPEEFKRVSMNLGTVTGKLDDQTENVEIQMSDEIYNLPDLQQHS